MTTRENIARLHSIISDAHAELAIIYQAMHLETAPVTKPPAKAPPPTPRAHRPDDVEPANVQAGDPDAMTGEQFYETLKRDPANLKRAQSLGKKLCNVDWRVTGWDAATVDTVRRALDTDMPGGLGPRRKAVPR